MIRKFSMLLLIILTSASLSGCGIFSMLGKAWDTKDPAVAEATPVPTDEGNPGVIPSPVPEETKSAFEYTLIQYPTGLSEDGKELVKGDYYEIRLPDEVKERYPMLQERVETQNAQDLESMVSFLQGSAEQAKMTGGMTFEDYREFTPVRADGKALSFVEYDSVYLGGAHPYGSFSAMNIDPETGDDISFASVCIKTDDLPELIYEELLLQNEDLESYFENLEGGKDSLLESIEDRLKEDAAGLCWTLDYDGIWIYFGDYGMGSYAAGTRTVKILFEDHPDHFTQEFLCTDEELPSIEAQVSTEEAEYTEVPPGDHVIEVGYMRDLKYEDAAPPHFYCIQERFSVPDVYPELNQKLEAFDQETKKALEGGFEDFGELIANLREAAGDDPETEYLDYHFGTYLALMRADTKVFSFAKLDNYVSADPFSRRTVTGYNYETDTGRELALTDVVTDTNALLDALEEKLSEEDYSVETFNSIFTELDSSLKEGASGSSSDSLSWTAGYEGLTFYFNTTVNYNVFSRISGAFTVFLPYRAYPELFHEEYTKTDYAYAQDIVIDSPWSEYFYIDPDFDGEYEKIAVDGTADKTGFYSSLRIGGPEYDYTELKYGTAAEVSGFVARDVDGFYKIYIQRNLDDGVIITDIYDITGEGVGYSDSFEGSLRYTDYNPEYFDPVFGHTFTTPSHFYISMLNMMMGRNFVEGAFRADYGGVPVPEGDYIGFDSIYYDIEPKEDLEVMIVDQDGNEIESGILKKATPIAPLRCTYDAKDAILDVMDLDGTIYRLEIHYNEDSGNWEFNGSEMSRYFDGLAYY